ncbi:MAG TPA: helix-turn-helix domain-containing protein [Gryllotalpicola sp.]
MNTDSRTNTTQPPASRMAIVLARFPLGPGQRFDEHVHELHQLAWVRDGVLTVSIGDRNWILPPTLALWVPAGTWHTSAATRTAATMQGVYLPAEILPEWTTPTVVGMSPLLRELIDFLCRDDLADDSRRKAEALIPELLEPTRTLTIEVPMPQDARAAQVAAALVEDPGDGRDLTAWGVQVSASARTLSRLFPAETGLGFAQWRLRLRLRAALEHLSAGESVSITAALVGFASASAFVAAFREFTGTTPGAYFAEVERLADVRQTLSE